MQATARPLEYDRDLSTDLPPKYQMILKRLRPSSRILEVGCHTGYFSKALQDAGHFVTGVEIDPMAAEVARSRGLEVYETDMTALSETRELHYAFDVVLLMDVLEHSADPTAALRSIQKCMPEGGRVMITAPNVAYWKVRLDLARGRWDYRDGGILDRTHLRFFALNGWKALLEDAGLEVQTIEIADRMIPVENRLKRFALFAPLVERLSGWCASLWPEMFAIGFFFECRSKIWDQKKK